MLGARRVEPTSILKRYRTDILIDELDKYIGELENEVKQKHLKVFEHNDQTTLLGLVSAREFVSNSQSEFDYYDVASVTTRSVYVDKLDAEENSNDIYQSYKINLIRYEIVKKLNKELLYARTALAESMKNQDAFLIKCRERVEWLENEIERIILSNPKIKYPMQKKVLFESNLVVVKQTFEYQDSPEPVVEEPVITEDEEKEIEIKKKMSMTPQIEPIIQLEFQWDDKKSTASTQSLLEEDSDDEFLKSVLSPKGQPEQTTEHKSPVQESDHKTDENEIEEEQLIQKPDIDEPDMPEVEGHVDKIPTPINEQMRESPMKSPVKSPIKSPVKSSVKSSHKSTTTTTTTPTIPVLQIEPKQDDDRVTIVEENVELVDEELSKTGVDLLSVPHRRYEYADYSKEMVALNPSSYHQLGIAMTDSYLKRDEMLRTKIKDAIKKEKLNHEDMDFIEIGRELETMSRKICLKSNSFSSNVAAAMLKKSSARKSDDYWNMDDEEVEDQKESIIEVKLPKNMVQSLNKTRPMSYRPPALLPAINLPMPRRKNHKLYPRPPSVYSSAPPQYNINHPFHPPLLVNQHNLKDQTKIRLYHPPVQPKGPPVIDLGAPRKIDNNRTPPSLSWSELKPNSSPLFHSGPKYEKIKSLLSTNLRSSCHDERRDAIKHIGLLEVGDHGAVHLLTKLLKDPSENEVIKFEAAKSLISLGEWSELACDLFARNLQTGNYNLKLDVIQSVANGKNARFTDLENQSIQTLVKLLEEYVLNEDMQISLEACISIGKLGVKTNQLATARLVFLYERFSDWNKKAMCLESLVKLFDCSTRQIFKFIMNQMEMSPYWTARISAIRLLSFMGPVTVCTHECFNELYKLLETRLAHDPVREVRLVISDTIKDLKIYDVFARSMIRNLKDPDDETRLRAVISIEMLNVRKRSVINVLLDMLDIDPSQGIRLAVLKALQQLAPNNYKVKKMTDQQSEIKMSKNLVSNGNVEIY